VFVAVKKFQPSLMCDKVSYSLGRFSPTQKYYSWQKILSKDKQSSLLNDNNKKVFKIFAADEFRIPQKMKIVLLHKEK
jgi:hypothetical protein